jgi:hypothetical protein
MDQRRALANIVSSFDSEFEMLVPLIVFPDEVLEYKVLGEELDYEEKLKLGFDFKTASEKKAQNQGVRLLEAKDSSLYNQALDVFSDAMTDDGTNQCRHIFR